MNYLIPSIFGLIWIVICLLLLLIPSRPYEIAIMAIALMILHFVIAGTLNLKKNLNETNLVELGISLVMLIMCLGFILYALAIHYEMIQK